MAKITFQLQKILDDKGLTVDQAASVTKLSRPTLYKLKSGNATGIQFETIQSLCNGLDVRPCDLFVIEEVNKTNKSKSVT